MKISSIKNCYNIFEFDKEKISKKNTSVSKPFDKFAKTADIVSFSAKKYDAESIVNPTNHCAYCGCKVYNELQLESMAKEILQNKAERLEGRVKSILEKLEGAKNAQDIAIAKRLENQDEINFFKKFLEISRKKSFLRGDAIFEQVYNLDKDKAFEILVKNMTPLLKTIDHVTPQNEDKENQDVDSNLVEACYCCNHDIKKGESFSEFYAIFPSIKNNMPSDKFNYAISSVLDFSQTSIMQRISAQSLAKLIERLFIQKTEASNYMESINFRLKGCKSSISKSVQTCENEIKEKEEQIADFQAKLDLLKQDPEYVAMLDRIALNERLNSQNTLLDSLRVRRQRNSDSLNALRNPKPHKKQQNKVNRNEEQMTPEEKAAKIAALKAVLDDLSEQISKQEEAVFSTQLEISQLDDEFPTVEMVQRRKAKVEAIYNAYIALEKERKTLDEKIQSKQELEKQETALKEEISSLPQNSDSFDMNLYSEPERQQYERFINLTEALAYIEEHPNGSMVKAVINQAAKETMTAELQKLEKEPVVIHYKQVTYRKNLEIELAKMQKNIAELNYSINNSKKAIVNYKRASSEMPFDEATKQMADFSEDIRRLNDKQNYVKIPQRISILKAEAALLKSTIEDLLKKDSQIDLSFNVTA